MWQSKEVRFPIDHPTAAGHFPCHPVIPGAVLLDEAIKAFMEGVERDGDIVIRAAKFPHPVRPGEIMVLRWDVQGSVIRFECWLDGDRLAASGTIERG